MMRFLYVNPDPSTQDRATALGCGWFPAVPPEFASIASAPCVILSVGGLPPVVIPEPTTPSAVTTAAAPLLAADQAVATANATAQSNRDTIVQQAQTALANNRAFIALASPTNAQVIAQTKALSQQMNGLIRLVLGQLDATN